MASRTSKRDTVKSTWEETEFPLVCETCLGDNPYVRMTKEPHGKKCQVCETPFTVFGWQAGTKGRWKRVEICRSCAQAKNVCQVCIYDLQYGLPVKVRDRVLRETAAATVAASSTTALQAVPQSKANRSWYTAQQQRQNDGQIIATDAAASGNNQLAHATLQQMARMEPRYERNLPKLCSFFARGECDRGSHCPFRHEMPRDRNDPMSQQNTRDRFYGSSDPVANKILGRKRKQEALQDKKNEQEGYELAKTTLFLRFQGDGPFPTLTETDVRDLFYAYGEIISVRVHNDRGFAFVEYTQPEATELAIASTNNIKTLLDHPIHVTWARAPKRGETTATTTYEQQQQQQVSTPAATGQDRSSAVSSGQPRISIPPPPGTSSGDLTKRIPPPPGGGHAKTVAAATTTSSSSTTKSMKPLPKGLLVVAKNIQPSAAGTNVPTSAATATKRTKPSSSSYYPSSDPGRLGSKAASSST